MKFLDFYKINLKYNNGGYVGNNYGSWSVYDSKESSKKLAKRGFWIGWDEAAQELRRGYGLKGSTWLDVFAKDIANGRVTIEDFEQEDFMKNIDKLAMDLYSVIRGMDYMTGSPVARVEEFGYDYSAARALLEAHPEIKALAGYFQRERNDAVARMRSQRDAARVARNELRTRYNELCEEYAINDYIEEFHY